MDHLCLFPKVNSIMIKTLKRRSLTQSSRFASSQSSDKRHLNVEQYYWASGTGWARWAENFMVKTEKISFQCPNVSTTPNTAMGCRQCLSFSVVQLKGKHCRKPHCHNGVVDMFGLYHSKIEK